MNLPLRRLLLPLTLMLPVYLQAEEPGPRIGSTVYSWESRVANPTPVGARREVARNPTATLHEFECHISTLNPSQASHPPHTHAQEELIILQEGELDVHINGTNTRVGPGSLFFFAANDPHAVQNHGSIPATYFVFNFSTAVTDTLRGKAPLPADPARRGSSIFRWEDLVVTPTKNGERRAVTDQPTSTLANFECHVTTVAAGEAPHAPHRHPDEEFLLVKAGQLEVTINGETQQVGPGSIVFVSSGDEHGWRNVGDTPATYYVMRLKSERTPAVVAMQ